MTRYKATHSRRAGRTASRPPAGRAPCPTPRSSRDTEDGAHDLRRKKLVNGEPAAAVVTINQDSDGYPITPLFVSVTPSITLRVPYRQTRTGRNRTGKMSLRSR